nr:integrase, catalytic region, zinc finger, CCHC-type, peptidase aspartic, catalytic [Tanacetum cinerariifolium]
MWKAIERLKQGESINVQDLETNLFWEFGKFTSLDGQRFVTLVKQSQELKNVSYHKLYDILKQHQHEVNEIRAEKIACVANPLALVAQQQQVYHPQTHPTQYNQNSSTITHQATTRNKGKDKEIDKLMALISLSFKKIYKPTNNNLRTSSNTSRVNQDNSPRIHRNARYESQRSGNVAGARETVDAHNVIIKSEDMNYDIEQIDQNDEDDDLAEEQRSRVSFITVQKEKKSFNKQPTLLEKWLDESIPLGLNHNLFSVGQFCDADLEVAFRKSTCFIRDLKGNDLLTGSRGTDLYSITLQGTNSPNPICLMAKATSSQAWLWHRRLSHLNFDTINLLSKNDIV